METYLTAAIDPRIAVAVPCISVQSFAWGLAHDQWHDRIGTVQGAFDRVAKSDGVEHPDAKFVKAFYDRLVPGIDGEFDCPNLLPMIAPRPLLTINGENDKINPLAGATIAIDSAKRAYESVHASDHLVTEVEPKPRTPFRPRIWTRPSNGLCGGLIHLIETRVPRIAIASYARRPRRITRAFPRAFALP